MTSWLFDLYYGLIFVAPAMIANAVPVFVSGLGRMDGGRTFIDGKPLLGSHKSNGGLLSALISGGLVGLAAPLFFPEIFAQVDNYHFTIGILMGFGAMLGDSLGSFTKRRIKIKPGAPFPIVDQVGFVIMAYLLAAIFVDFPIIWPILVIPATLAIHIAANLLAFGMGWKDVWY